MSQTKTHSFIESWVNVTIGWSINFCVQLILFPAVGVHVTLAQNLTISATFTVISVTRSYLLRRWFNRVTNKQKGKA